MALLTILKADIMERDFYNCNDCPITLALQRAGYKDATHTGISIWIENESFRNDSVKELTDKVVCMYFHKWNRAGEYGYEPIEPADFEMEVDLS